MLLVYYLVVVWACFFWQRICRRFFPDVRLISFPIFLNSHFIFGLMFGIHGNFFRFWFSVLYSWLFLLFFLLFYFITKFFKSCLSWPLSKNILIKNFPSSSFFFTYLNVLKGQLSNDDYDTLITVTDKAKEKHFINKKEHLILKYNSLRNTIDYSIP